MIDWLEYCGDRGSISLFSWLTLSLLSNSIYFIVFSYFALLFPNHVVTMLQAVTRTKLISFK